MYHKTALVLGGTGGVGEGIVKVLLQQGLRVIVPSRSEQKLVALQQYVADIPTGELVLYRGSVDSPEAAEALALFLQQTYRFIDMAVVSLGGWHQGYPLYNYPVKEWYNILQNNLTNHFLAIKAVLPSLNPKESFYFHINGFSAEQAYPMAGPVAMAAAAQKSLMLTLAEEMHRSGIHVHELILGPIKTRDRIKRGHGQADWYTPEEVGEFIVGFTQSPKPEIVHYLLAK